MSSRSHLELLKFQLNIQMGEKGFNGLRTLLLSFSLTAKPLGISHLQNHLWGLQSYNNNNGLDS